MFGSVDLNYWWLKCFNIKLASFFQEGIADLVSADDSGLLCVWKSGEDFQLLNKIPGFEYVRK